MEDTKVNSSENAQDLLDLIGPQVAQLANRMKVKQTRIAQDCEISRISVNRFFRGRSEIRATDLVNVLKVLGIDLEHEIQRRLQPPQY